MFRSTVAGPPCHYGLLRSLEQFHPRYKAILLLVRRRFMPMRVIILPEHHTGSPSTCRSWRAPKPTLIQPCLERVFARGPGQGSHRPGPPGAAAPAASDRLQIPGVLGRRDDVGEAVTLRSPTGAIQPPELLAQVAREHGRGGE